jgi:serine phosphatase RsbU (regulator of sigma subunit)
MNLLGAKLGGLVPRISIRQKLALLIGIPVLGAAVLALLIVGAAREQSRRAQALGSVESLAELSAEVTGALHALQAERSQVALALGRRAADRAVGPRAAADQQAVRFSATDDRLRALNRFLGARDVAKLPPRLAWALEEANGPLAGLGRFRATVRAGQPKPDEVLDYYGKPTHALVRAIAAMTDLSDDGEFLRLVTSLVALLEYEERASEEHALLSYVFAVGDFPPGTYRKLVTLVSEQDTYTGVFQTLASVEHQKTLFRKLRGDVSRAAMALRQKALAATDDTLDADPDAWDDAQRRNLEGIIGFEDSINQEIRTTVLRKIEQIRRSTNLGTGLAAGVIFVSLFFGWLVARGITRRVDSLRNASKLVGQGDLSVRVDVTSNDELGQLGGAFNDMIVELGEAHAALNEQARMARELEIAATIQRAMLPPSPSHPDFEFAGKMAPANEVGGDFYDVLSSPEKRALWITIGDVSGHGVGAGLVMLMTQVAFAAHFLCDPMRAPDDVFRQVNSLLRENITDRLHDDKYVTGQLLAYAGNGRFHGVGSHVWPIVYRANRHTCDVIATEGPWLGILPTLDEVPITTIELGVGDVLCLYSDGITEAPNGAGELFDTDRLASTLARVLAENASLAGAADQVFDAVEAFSGRHEDDWTLMLVRRTGPAAAV